jgi:hypothetical protein
MNPRAVVCRLLLGLGVRSLAIGAVAWQLGSTGSLACGVLDAVETERLRNERGELIVPVRLGVRWLCAEAEVAVK